MTDMNGKRVLITGGSGGIGSAIAKLLYKNGAKILLTGTSKEKLSKVASEISSDIKFINYNLKNIKKIPQFIKDCEETLQGNIEVLINNAGITKDNLSIRLKEEDWLDVININLNSTFFLSREVIKGMLRKKNGRIISISSILDQ